MCLGYVSPCCPMDGLSVVVWSPVSLAGTGRARVAPWAGFVAAPPPTGACRSAGQLRLLCDHDLLLYPGDPSGIACVPVACVAQHLYVDSGSRHRVVRWVKFASLLFVHFRALPTSSSFDCRRTCRRWSRRWRSVLRTFPLFALDALLVLPRICAAWLGCCGALFAAFAVAVGAYCPAAPTPAPRSRRQLSVPCGCPVCLRC